MGLFKKMAVDASVWDLRKQGFLQRDEQLIAYAWEEPELPPTVAGLPMALQYVQFGVNRNSWNLTDRALVLIPFSAMVKDRVRRDIPRAHRFPYDSDEWMLDVVPLPDLDMLLINIRVAEGAEGVLYRGEFRPVELLFSSGFVDALNFAAQHNRITVRHVRIKGVNSELDNDPQRPNAEDASPLPTTPLDDDAARWIRLRSHLASNDIELDGDFSWVSPELVPDEHGRYKSYHMSNSTWIRTTQALYLIEPAGSKKRLKLTLTIGDPAWALEYAYYGQYRLLAVFVDDQLVHHGVIHTTEKQVLNDLRQLHREHSMLPPEDLLSRRNWTDIDLDNVIAHVGQAIDRRRQNN